MAITLTPDQEAWLQAHVATGDFSSIEEVARQLIDDERIVERELEKDDLVWAKPLVEDGLAALERGEFISLEEHRPVTPPVLPRSKGDDSRYHLRPCRRRYGGDSRRHHP